MANPRVEGSPFFDPTVPQGQLRGKFVSRVMDVQDPQKQGRVRLYIPQLFSGRSTDQRQWSNWAKPAWAIGGCDSDSNAGDKIGMFVVPPVGSRVWVSFELGNPDFPVYEGGYFREGATPPENATGGNDGSSAASFTVGGVNVPTEGGGASTYPFNRMYKSESGILVELDDTPDNVRIRIHHPQGSYVEFDKNGSVAVVAKSGQKVILGANTGDFHVAVQNVVLGASTSVKIGGTTAVEPLVLGTSQKTKLDALLAALATFSTALSGSSDGAVVSAASALGFFLSTFTLAGTLSAKHTTE